MQRPLVSIGVPIYNDEKWLRNSLDHLLAQDYKNIEIIIADDVSSDNSSVICREYAAKDQRVKFFQNKFNLGAVRNHEHVFELSSGDYFAWGSGHYYFHHSFISKCLEILESDESVILCCSQTQYIDVNDSVIRETKENLNTRGLPFIERFKKILYGSLTTPSIFYGFYRSNILAKSQLSRKTIAGDLIFLTEIALLGVIAQIDEVLFYRKICRHETPQQAFERWINTIVQPKGFCLEAIVPHLTMAYEYVKMIEHSNLSLTEKEVFLKEVMEFITKMRGGEVLQDIVKLVSVGMEGISKYKTYPEILKTYTKELLLYINIVDTFLPNIKEINVLRSVCLTINGLREDNFHF
jgi:glycosyltransferase involved in cell wall biosynthesis